MSKIELKSEKKTRRIRSRHGGYSYLAQGNLPEDRPYIRKYLTSIREGLIADLGPSEQDLTTAQKVLIDRTVTKLGIVRCIEEHVKENGVMRGHILAPSLKDSYLAYNNSIRLNLQALGINKRQAKVLDLQSYIRENEKEQKK